MSGEASNLVNVSAANPGRSEWVKCEPLTQQERRGHLDFFFCEMGVR